MRSLQARRWGGEWQQGNQKKGKESEVREEKQGRVRARMYACACACVRACVRLCVCAFQPMAGTGQSGLQIAQCLPFARAVCVADPHLHLSRGARGRTRARASTSRGWAKGSAGKKRGGQWVTYWREEESVCGSRQRPAHSAHAKALRNSATLRIPEPVCTRSCKRSTGRSSAYRSQEGGVSFF